MCIKRGQAIIADAVVMVLLPLGTFLTPKSPFIVTVLALIWGFSYGMVGCLFQLACAAY